MRFSGSGDAETMVSPMIEAQERSLMKRTYADR
jgi:hypothetical protein